MPGAPGRIRTRDPLLRRCRTVVRCGRLPAEIVCTRLIGGHGIQPRWCRSWVSPHSSIRTRGDWPRSVRLADCQNVRATGHPWVTNPQARGP
jgi:hypothetical protein